MNKPNYVPPPAGYSSWLDFAVETFDTRGLWVETLLIEDRDDDRGAMRDAARSELRALRASARGKSDPES